MTTQRVILLVEVLNSEQYRVVNNNNNNESILADMVIDNLNDVIVRYILIEKKGESDNENLSEQNPLCYKVADPAFMKQYYLVIENNRTNREYEQTYCQHCDALVRQIQLLKKCPRCDSEICETCWREETCEEMD